MTGTPRRLVWAAFAWNFLTIGAYSMIGPARGALLMTKFGPGSLPWVYMGSAALTGAVVRGYERCAKAPRRWLVGGSLVMLALTLGGGALAVAAASSPIISFSYFLWTDVFGIMSVTLFWTYQNDVFHHDEAKELFGLVAAAARRARPRKPPHRPRPGASCARSGPRRFCCFLLSWWAWSGWCRT